MNSIIGTAVRFVVRTVLTLVHLVEAADGGVSALFRTAGVFDAFNHHNMRALVFLVVFVVYDWIRSGDNIAHVVGAIREYLKQRKP